MKRFILFILGLLISLGAIYYLTRGDIGTIKDELQGGRYEYLFPVLGLYFFALVARAYRWQALLNHRIRLWDSFHIMMIGYLFSLLPLRVGELIRAWLTTRLDPPIQFLTSFSSIVVERILDLLAILVLLGVTLVTLPVPSEVKASGAFFGVTTLILAIAMIFFAHKRPLAHRILSFFLHLLPLLKRLNLIEWLDHALDGLHPLTNWRTATEGIFWTAISWGLSVLIGYFLMLVFFPEGSWAGITLMLALSSLAVAIPSVPGNLGTFEASATAGLYFAGVIASTEAPHNVPAVAFSLTLHAIGLSTSFMGGMLGLYIQGTSFTQVQTGFRDNKPPN